MSRPINIDDYLVVETSDFENANADGSITVPSGGEQVLLEHEPETDQSTVFIHALGAADANDIAYRVYYGQNIAFTMESPPGTITAPYSFTENLGGPLATNDLFQLTAINARTSDLDLAARAHIEEK